MNQPLSNQPPKGTRDWTPDEFRIRKYIFDTWRRICVQYGYQEYLTPLVEHAEVYRAKSGEDVGGKELVTFTDLGGRELSIRPEMTPSVTRMVTTMYREVPKPLRLFSIANFMRNEKPQRGRNREFWQLNYDIFGADELAADTEVVQMALDIMLAFNPPADSFKLLLNHRELISGLLDLVATPETQIEVARTLDKFEKLPEDKFVARLTELGLDETKIAQVQSFMTATTVVELAERLPELVDNPGLDQIQGVMTTLTEMGYGDWIYFQPNVIRGFDYYDGLVFEVFDTHPDNNRSMFGGGRYNGLAGIFGSENFPAVGSAPGDETTRLFLESWDLLDQITSGITKCYFVPVLDESLAAQTQSIAKQLRSKGEIVELGTTVRKMGKAIEQASKKNHSHVVIFNTDEQAAGIYKIKDLNSGGETEHKLSLL